MLELLDAKGKKIEFFVEKEKIEISDAEAECFLQQDIRGVWAIFYEKCREKYLKKNPNIERLESDLYRNGVEHIASVLSDKDVTLVRSIIENSSVFHTFPRSSGSNVTEEADVNVTYTAQHIEINAEAKIKIYPLLYRILNNETVKKIESLMQSYFAIDHIFFSRTYPDADPIVSFRWHRDAGPKFQTHIMVYLSDSEETGGRTEFINYHYSGCVELSGYAGNKNIERRATDLKYIVPDMEVIAPKPRAGDIIIFNATQIYHQGIHPNTGYRDVMFIILRPDMMSWSKSVDLKKVFSHPRGLALFSQNPFSNYATLTRY